MVFSSTCPSLIIGTGDPLIALERVGNFSIRQDSSSSSPTSTRIGSTPFSSGRPFSCIGTEARSDSSSVTTSSDGCSSPICRLPISRIATISRKYRITVRMTEMHIFLAPFYC